MTWFFCSILWGEWKNAVGEGVDYMPFTQKAVLHAS